MKKIFNKIQEKEICQLYKVGHSMLELARKFNCGATTISRVLKKNNSIIRTSGENQKIFDKRQENEICKLYLSGDTSNMVGFKFNCSEGTVLNILKQNKILRRANGTWNTNKYKDLIIEYKKQIPYIKDLLDCSYLIIK